MTILFFGDVVGKLGRRALAKALPELKKKYQPDLIMANVENLAHGQGVTAKTLNEIKTLGINVFTSGNHVTKKGEYGELLKSQEFNLLRPANYPPTVPGKEYLALNFKTKNGLKKIYIINLLGRVFFSESADCPFRKLDYLLKLIKPKKSDIILIDLHAEATSEKVAFGWYADGRVSVVLGTHTHVPTADEKILPGGTGYLTDVGMVGGVNTVIGVKKEIIIDKFLTQTGMAHEFPENGQAVINAVVVAIDDKTAKCLSLKRIEKLVHIN
ncbi:MAG TPA: TIGR00282 family metallophosphoesterase [bacterium]|nr:TIGR00282 family metallophosphoesterase [bacterium]HPL95545.1 TIGR00282 family metallophosphoesterase [bacterium]